MLLKIKSLSVASAGCVELLRQAGKDLWLLICEIFNQKKRDVESAEPHHDHI